MEQEEDVDFENSGRELREVKDSYSKREKVNEEKEKSEKSVDNT